MCQYNKNLKEGNKGPHKKSTKQIKELYNIQSRSECYRICCPVLYLSFCTFMKVHSLTVVTFPLYTYTMSYIFIYIYFMCIEKFTRWRVFQWPTRPLNTGIMPLCETNTEKKSQRHSALVPRICVLFIKHGVFNIFWERFFFSCMSVMPCDVFCDCYYSSSPSRLHLLPLLSFASNNYHRFQPSDMCPSRCKPHTYNVLDTSSCLNLQVTAAIWGLHNW